MTARAVVAAVAFIAIVAFALTRGSSGGDRVGTRHPTTTQPARPGQLSGAVATDAASTAPLAAGDPVAPTGGVADAPIPVDLSVSNTSDLGDGDAVAIHATSRDGAALYGYEAHLCIAGATYRFDADVRPTQLGKCISRPLSPSSEQFQQVAAQPPYQSVDGSFRVGVGSDSYQTQDGRTITITCDHDHPCTLVVKLQYTDGFGFRSIPITYR